MFDVVLVNHTNMVKKINVDKQKYLDSINIKNQFENKNLGIKCEINIKLSAKIHNHKTFSNKR